MGVSGSSGAEAGAAPARCVSGGAAEPEPEPGAAVRARSEPRCAVNVQRGRHTPGSEFCRSVSRGWLAGTGNASTGRVGAVWNLITLQRFGGRVVCCVFSYRWSFRGVWVGVCKCMQITCLASGLSLPISLTLIFDANIFKLAFQRNRDLFSQRGFFSSQNKSVFYISLLSALFRSCKPPTKATRHQTT